MANGKIEFDIDFKIRKENLSALEDALNYIRAEAKSLGDDASDSLKRAGQIAKELETIIGKSFNKDLGTVNVNKFNQELKKSNLTLKDVQSSFAKLGPAGADAYNLIGISILNTNIKLKQSSKLLNDMATTFKNTVRYGISSSIFNTMANSIQRAYDFSKQLNTSLNDIRIVTGQSAEQMDRFATTANNAAKALGATTLDYTKAALIYYQQGLSEEEVQARAGVTVKTANVTGQSASDVSEQLTAVWNGYKVTADETELYIDKLAKVAAGTAADLEELSTGMSKVASAASNAGVDIDTLNGLLATAVSVTRESPETIGTSLRTLFARMGDLKLGKTDEDGVGLGKVSSQLHALGVEVLDQKGNMRDMGDIIKDLAAKWQDLTKAQQQAAAVAIGGKMQYSRLIAIMDNWDMVTNAIQMSEGAIGSLQDQQDIYMDSTQAKLNKLQSTWEDFYMSLINDNEVQGGVGVLTNIVASFDNFVDAFGGGGKAIAAFGTLVANVFNRQIGSAIANTVMRYKNLESTAEVLKRQTEAVKTGPLGGGNEALEANYRIQAQYAEKLLESKRAFSEEEVQQLEIERQQVGALEQQLVEQRELIRLKDKAIKSDRTQDRNNTHGVDVSPWGGSNLPVTFTDTRTGEKQSITATDYVSNVLGEFESFQWDTDDFINDIKRFSSEWKTFVNEIDENSPFDNELIQNSENFKAIMIDIKNDLNNLDNNYEWIDMDNEIKNYKARYQEITKYIEEAKNKNLSVKQVVTEIQNKIDGIKENHKDINEDLEEQKNDLREINREYEKEEKIRNERDVKKGIHEEKLDNGAQKQNIMQEVSQITSAISTITVAWSSVKMLMETWNDDSLSFGDKIIQTITSITMLIPSVISSLTTLNETFDIAKTYKDAYNAAIEAGTVAQEANIAVTEGEAVVEETGAASKALSTAASEGKTAATTAETGAEIANNAATTSNTAQEVANTAAKGAATGATWSLAAANEALNAVLAANPIIAVMMVLVALVGTIAAVTSAIDKNTESIVKNNEETIKNSKEKIKEIDQNQKLCQSYLDVAEAYKKAEATKKELEDASQKVLDELQDEDLRIIALTGNYEKLTEAIRGKNKEAAKEKWTEYNAQKNAAYDSFVQTLGNNNKSAGWFQGGNWFQLDQTSTWGGYEQGQAVKSFYQYLKDNGITIKETQEKSGYTNYMIEQTQLMQAEQLAEKWAQSANSDIKGTEFYEKVTEKFIGSTKDYVKEYYEAGQEALMQQIEATAPSEVPEDIKAFWKETFNKIKSSDAYVTLSESEQRALTDDILKNLYSDNTEISNFIKRREYLQGFENAGADQGQLDRLEEIINALESVDNLPKLLSGQDFKEFLDNYEYYYELAQKITQLANLEETDTTIERSLELLQKNKDLTDKEKEELASLRNNLEDKYNLLADITDKNSHEYLKALREIRETNEKVEKEALIGIRDQKQDLVEGIVKRLEAYDPNDNTKYIDIEADLSKYEKAMEELKKADYEVKVKIQADFDSDTINDMDLAREFDSLRNLIKSDLKYTYDEAQKIAAEGNGALFLNAKKTAEGTIEVDKEVARNFVKNKQIQLDADKDAAISQMQTQKEILIAQEEILTNEIEQLKTALTAKDGATAQSALNTVKQYEKEYKAKVTELNNALDANAEAAEEEKKIDQDLYEQLGGMYDQNTANYKSSQEEATTINAENITRRVKNIRAEYDAFVATGAANVESESGYVETPFPDSDISGTSGTGGTDPRHKHKQTQKHKSITYDTYGAENVTHVEEAFDPDGILAKYFTKTEDGQWVLTSDESEQQLYRQTLEKQIAELEKEKANNKNSQGIIDMRIAALQDAKASLEKHLAGLGVGGSGSGSGSTSEKENKDELDIYHQINTELDIIANNLADISKQKEKAFGAEKIKLLNKEISELNKQIDANKRKLAIMKEEAFGNAEKGTEGLQQKLSKYGVTFDNATGQVTNYDEIWNTRHQILLDEYNTYNAMSSDAQKDYEEKIKAVEDEWEQFKEDIDRYDTIVSKEMHEVQSNIDDEMRQQIADNIEKFSMELTIRLDMQEAIKNWDKFKRDIIDDWNEIWESNTFSKGFFDENGNWQTNLKRTAQEDLDLLNSYFYKNYESVANPGSMLQGSGVVGTQITKLAELRGEVEKAFNGQNGLFGEDQYIETQTALDKLKEYKEAAMSTATEIKDLIDSIKGAYLGALQEATEEFSEQVDLLERSGKYIEHDMKLIKLIYGDNQYKALSEYYQKQHENNLQQLDFQTKQRDFWKAQMDMAKENSDEWEYAKEQWLAAIDSANEALEQAIETAKEKWENAIDEVFERLDRKFTDGLGLDYIKEEWSLINKNSDEYLDAINSAYGIQKLQNKYLDAIDKSMDVNNQRRLNELMNSEVEYLQQIDRLTQTDLERAELKLQIALKQMELEDAQNNKTSMRLRRDSQGNYSYQFVANNDDINKAKEELDELNNKLYNFDLKAYRQNLDKAASAYEEFMQKMAEASKIENEEDRIAQRTLLEEQYYEYIGMLQDENVRYSTNLIESATKEHGELYTQEALDFENMTKTEIDAFMNGLVPQWKSGVQDMMDQWSGKDGFKESVSNAIDELEEKDEEYRGDLDKVAETAEVDFGKIKEAADDTRLNALDPFIEANDDIIDRYEEQVDYIFNNLIPALGDLQDEYRALIDEINEANRLQGLEYEEAADRAKEDWEGSNTPNPKYDDINIDKNPSPVWEDEGSKGGGAIQSSGGNGQVDIGEMVTYTGGPYYETSYGEGKHGTRGPGKMVEVTGIAKGRPYPIHVKSSDSAYGWLREDQLTGYDTGGYTGAWGDNGRLAVLHQKELVLNAQDTSNFLNALDIMRNIVSNIGSEAFSRLASIGGNRIGDPAFAGIEQNVVINADFPNATDHNEIQQAFDNLMNIASQRVNRNRI